MDYEMTYSPLGKTGMNISRISYGAAGLGDLYTPIDPVEANDNVARSIEEYGINYFDAAPSYGIDGLAEERLGTALQGRRDKVFLATKCGRYAPGSLAVNSRPRMEFDYTPKRLRDEVEQSLRRLKTDHLDVLQLHDITNAPTLTYLVEESVPELMKLRDEGKTRFLGVTGAHLGALKYVAERCDCIDVILTFGRYNVMDTTLVGYFDDLLVNRELGILNSSILLMGIIANNYAKALEYYRKHPRYEDIVSSLDKARALCTEHGTELGTVAAQFGMHCDCVASTMISMSRNIRLEQNMRLFHEAYDEELVSAVYAILNGHGIFMDMPLKY